MIVGDLGRGLSARGKKGTRKGTLMIVTTKVCVVGLMLLCGAATARGETIASPTIDGIVRDIGLFGKKDGAADTTIDDGEVRIINAPWTEDRGVIEFSLLGLFSPVLTASVSLPMSDCSGPYPFTIDVFTYAGDGMLTLSDWDAGTLLTSFEYSGEELVVVDTTSFIATAIAAGSPYAGFNVRFAGPSNIDRFRGTASYLSFGSVECDSAALLSIATVPEPGTGILMLLVIGVVIVVRRGRQGNESFRRRRLLHGRDVVVGRSDHHGGQHDAPLRSSTLSAWCDWKDSRCDVIVDREL